MAFFIIMIISSVLQSISQIRQGQQAEATGEYNARVAEQQAQAARQKATFEEKARREEGKRLRARQVAVAGKSGALLETFIPVFEQTATDTELDALAIRYGGDVNAIRYTNEARFRRMEGKQKKQSAYANAFGTLLSSASKISGGQASGPSSSLAKGSSSSLSK